MTEAEWLDSDDSHEMVRSLRGRVSGRKVRLVVCACCRLLWDKLSDERCRQAVAAAETSVDSPIPEDVLKPVQAGAQAAYEAVYYHGPAGSDYTPAQAVWCLALGLDFDAVSWLSVGSAGVSVVRDVFGNPFRP